MASEHTNAGKRLVYDMINWLLSPHRQRLHKVDPRWQNNPNSGSIVQHLHLYVQDNPEPSVIIRFTRSQLEDAASLYNVDARHNLEAYIRREIQPIIS
jgi:hypothetical protein